MKRFYFVRHGESEANITRIYGPRGQSPLTEKGRQQSQYLAGRFASLPVDIILSSPYLRTKETAELLNKKLCKPIEYSSLLVERSKPSELVGLPQGDAKRKEIEAEIRENHTKPNWHYSDEESFEDLRTRGRKALQFLLGRNENHITVVTHGQFLRMLVSLMIRSVTLTPEDFLHTTRFFGTINTGITIVEYDEKNMNQGWRLITWMDHAHLGD